MFRKSKILQFSKTGGVLFIMDLEPKKIKMAWLPSSSLFRFYSPWVVFWKLLASFCHLVGSNIIFLATGWLHFEYFEHKHPSLSAPNVQNACREPQDTFVLLFFVFYRSAASETHALLIWNRGHDHKKRGVGKVQFPLSPKHVCESDRVRKGIIHFHARFAAGRSLGHPSRRFYLRRSRCCVNLLQ